MADFPKPWYVAGGWAIDLYLGRQTRDHEDIEVALFRRDQAALFDALSAWTFHVAVPGVREPMKPWNRGEQLDAPIHEIHGTRDRGSPTALELLLNEAEGERWMFRRQPAVTRPIPLISLETPDGIPVLGPEIVLLFKAKAPRARDEVDFRNVQDTLDGERREWLRGALEQVHPGHPWLSAI